MPKQWQNSALYLMRKSSTESPLINSRETESALETPMRFFMSPMLCFINFIKKNVDKTRQELYNNMYEKEEMLC